MYNHSLFSADRATHLKIVVVPLIAVALLVVAALNIRSADAGGSTTAVAGHAPALYASSTSAVIR